MVTCVLNSNDAKVSAPLIASLAIIIIVCLLACVSTMSVLGRIEFDLGGLTPATLFETFALFYPPPSVDINSLPADALTCFSYYDGAGSFLQSNEYAYYNSASLSARVAESICVGMPDWNYIKAVAIFRFVSTYISYDEEFADAVRRGDITRYVPDTEEILLTRKGVCFDYASVYAAMLRSRGIPAKVVVGYAPSGERHAWNRVFLFNAWLLADPTYSLAPGSRDNGYLEDYSL